MGTNLGISIGTRTMGMAVLRDGALVDWRIKTFWKKWSTDKLEAIITVIHKQISRFEITSITLKKPVGSHCSGNIQRIVDRIQALSRERHIKLRECTIRDLKQRYTSDYRANKGILISALAVRYPELSTAYSKERSNRNPYHAKLFEAIECALTETGQ